MTRRAHRFYHWTEPWKWSPGWSFVFKGQTWEASTLLWRPVTTQHTGKEHQLMYQQAWVNPAALKSILTAQEMKVVPKTNVLWKYVALQFTSCVPVRPQHRGSRLSQPTCRLQRSLRVKRWRKACYGMSSAIWVERKICRFDLVSAAEPGFRTAQQKNGFLPVEAGAEAHSGFIMNGTVPHINGRHSLFYLTTST